MNEANFENKINPSEDEIKSDDKVQEEVNEEGLDKGDYQEKIKELNEKVEKFYKKPKTHEELMENVRKLKEIPEEYTEPKVVVKLGSPDRSHKFVYMKDGGKEYVIALPIESKAYHKDIVEFSERLYDKKFEVDGGGYIYTEGDKLIIDQSSGSYGLAPKERVKEILSEKFPGLEVEVRGKTRKQESEELREKIAHTLNESMGIYDDEMD